MTATLNPPATTTQVHDTVQTTFVEHLPRITRHAKYALRHIACVDTREDLICEVLALAWRHFISLSRRGKKPETFICTLALRCTQAVRGGRRVAGGDRTRDVLSPRARARYGFTLIRIAEYVSAPGADPTGPAGESVLAEALAVDPRARVPEQAAFRVDFPVWRDRFSPRDRAVLDALARGDHPGEVASQLALSPGRVSQLREAFRVNWNAFHRGEE